MITWFDIAPIIFVGVPSVFFFYTKPGLAILTRYLNG